ncbi:DNA polymerase III subunit epsilon [Candidatus Endowatersipora endosymbiont of Watersipora subatra]|uniref:DNA polymerase III subunit epsilon n=1 Tax=Candidatus Endowatersipora endosymbiont of Watersipora subatra TaxID=3077946 RepID=UPI00312C80E8
MSDNWQDNREVIFDTETTGLSAKNGDRIIEIGAVEMINRVPTGRTFHEYFHPGEKEVSPEAEAIHGISTAQLLDKPTFTDLLPKFEDFFGRGTLIAHNATFDIGFLNAELKRAGQPAIEAARVIDSLKIARRKFPTLSNSLDALCKRFGIKNTDRTLHGAFLDSQLLTYVYIELTGGLQLRFDLDHDSHDLDHLSTLDIGTRLQQKQRPNPLDSRLTPKEAEAHADMVMMMGHKAIWNKWK